jgi:Glycosyltransferases involved in cell wall biogenesis
MTTAQPTASMTVNASPASAYDLKYNANVVQSKTRQPEISVVIPVYNEEDNIALLYSKLVQALEALDRSWEAVLIDDGSTDKSFNKLAEIAGADERIKVVRFVKNFGQTAALAAGIDHARGDGNHPYGCRPAK